MAVKKAPRKETPVEKKPRAPRKKATTAQEPVVAKTPQPAPVEVPTVTPPVVEDEVFRLTPPPDSATPAEKEERVRVNLHLPKTLHRELRRWALDHDDKSLQETIEDMLVGYMKLVP